MGLFRKKPDPIKERARALESEIAALEAEINRLDSQLSPRPGSADQEDPERSKWQPAPASNTASDPIFEDVDLDRLEAPAEAAAKSAHYNELGVRKYDLPALLSRIKNHLRGPSTTNPKLVSYLAAGGIQGLRPMRYEKRVARNRFIALVLVLFLIMLGIVAVFIKQG